MLGIRQRDMRGSLFRFALRRPRSAAAAPPPSGGSYPNLAREWVGLTLTLIAFCLALTCTHLLHRADLAFLDAASRFVHRVAPNRIVVIAVDERSIEHLGGWPLRPEIHARMIDLLTQSGVAAIGLDVPPVHAPHATQDGEAVLADAIRRNGKVVMRRYAGRVPNGTNAGPDAAFDADTYANGHIKVHADQDGVIRSFYMLAGGAQGERHLADLLLRASGAAPVVCTAAEWRAAAINDAGCLRYVPLGRSKSYQAYSYIDVLQGQVPASKLAGKLVLVGPTAEGVGARLATPVIEGASLKGVEFVAEIANALATDTLTRPVSFWSELLFSESAVPLVCLSLYLLGPRASLVVSVALAAVIAACSYAMLRFAHLILPPAAGILTCAVAYPLWAWRRQEALLNYLSLEAARVMREPTLPEESGTVRLFIDPIQRRLNAMATLVERVRRYREFVSEWVDSLPEATLVTSPSGIVLLANERVFTLSEHSEVRRSARRSPAGRPVADVLFEITASHRAIDFASQALYSLEHWARGDDLPAHSESQLAQGIEITNARGGRSLLIKCAPIKPAAGRDGALIFHVADVSSVRKAERQRDMALRFLSHDMRSPQAALLALVEQMRQEPPRLTVHRFTQLVEQYATTALNLSDDFLFLARAESLPPKLTQVDPALVLGDAIDDLWPQASARSTTVNLIAEPGKSTMADVALLRRAFANLIGNAIKFSPQASTVNVHLAETERHLRISVIDQGIGISEQQRKTLFREFTQLDPRSSRSGHGLGLAFVKTVVDSLGGKLMVRSKPGEGATFMVYLPKVDIGSG
jgi:signal transduction histidine kinase/CHASE2 domain-containing sensor protein